MSLDYTELNACEMCDHCMGYYPDQFYCAVRNDNFGNIQYPQECENFDYAEEDDDDDDI